MARVVLAEDDPGISDPLARALCREGYGVQVCADGATALKAALTAPDLIVLDIGLPTMDGLEVCRRLRLAGHSTPVMMLTARSDEVDVVVGLDSGADDYVTKPFRLAELLARVRALMRRHTRATGPATHTSYGAPTVRIDLPAQRAYFGEEELSLTLKEFGVLAVLVREEGQVVSRKQLMREVWPSTGSHRSTKTLDMHVSMLRNKLSDDAQNPRYITTIRGVGYLYNSSE